MQIAQQKAYIPVVESVLKTVLDTGTLIFIGSFGAFSSWYLDKRREPIVRSAIAIIISGVAAFFLSPLAVFWIDDPATVEKLQPTLIFVIGLIFRDAFPYAMVMINSRMRRASKDD